MTTIDCDKNKYFYSNELVSRCLKNSKWSKPECPFCKRCEILLIYSLLELFLLCEISMLFKVLFMLVKNNTLILKVNLDFIPFLMLAKVKILTLL